MRVRLPVLVAAVVVVAAAAGWRLVRGRWGGATEAEKAAVVAQRAAQSAREAPEPGQWVARRADVNDATKVGELIQAYGVWASRPEATDARREIVRLLLAHPNVQVGVEALLAAVEGDQTPRRMDPMWDQLVAGLGALWRGPTFAYGRDLVELEGRAKPKDLVLESLASIPADALTPLQRTQLAADLVDKYPSVAADQKPLISKALGSLAGDDVVQILAGRGLAEGSQQLKLATERQRTLEHVRRHPVREAPPEE
jgi:hypothetical protein